MRSLGGTTWLLQATLHSNLHGELEQAFGLPMPELLDRWTAITTVSLDALDKNRQ